MTALRKGVLLVNLGSPDAPDPEPVGRYLTQFLMDSRVLDMAWPLRKLLVSALIVPRRKHESAHAYRKIWWPEGAPLVVISRQVRDALQPRVDLPVGLGMRYGNPSTEAAIRDLLASAGGTLDEILLVPLYPHYAMSSYETAVVEARQALARTGSRARLVVRPPFYKDPAYVRALVASARDHLSREYDHLLFSYHGIPERHVKKSDPTGRHCLASGDCCDRPSAAHAFCYRHQVFETTRAFVREAGVPAGKWSISFQSRLGRDPWLKPYTDFEFERLPAEGRRRLLVICPAFVSDCLETLEEIGMRGRESFMAAGGEEYDMIPCMNAREEWIEALAGWVREFAA